jgi:hypothetical protein
MTLQGLLSPNFTNWEVVALCLIKRLIVGNNLNFSRSELMSDNYLDHAIRMLSVFGHKKIQSKPKETLQRIIQNLRDKGYIDFLGQGEYVLTQKGKEALSNLKPELVQGFAPIYFK